MKKLLLAVLVVVFTVMFAGVESGPQAKKIRFHHSSKKAGAPAVLAHFVTINNQANTAKPTNLFCNGHTVHFYYKIGPVESVKSKGMPFRTRMVVEVTSRDGKKKKDFGWKDGNGVRGDMMKKSQTFGFYHSAGWNLNLSNNIEPGSDYSVTIYHNDLNSGKTLTMNYSFTTRMCP